MIALRARCLQTADQSQPNRSVASSTISPPQRPSQARLWGGWSRAGHLLRAQWPRQHQYQQAHTWQVQQQV